MSNLLQKLFLLNRKPNIPADEVKILPSMSKEDIATIKALGLTTADLMANMMEATKVNFDRMSFYREIDRAMLHPYISSALNLYADTATTFNQTNNATMFIQTDDTIYKNHWEKFVEIINLEEIIYDLAWNCAAYGDLFIKIKAVPKIGILSIDDGDHPLNISRVDVNGQLVGFYNTPQGGYGTGKKVTELLPPWQYVHLRLLGQKKKRPVYGDKYFTEYTSMTILSPEQRRMTTKYGTSILTNAIPVYKRLRLSEDSLLLARLSRGLLKYIYKVKVDSNNVAAVKEMIDLYTDQLKRARALNTGTDANFKDDFSPLAAVEDIILPVWDNVGDLTVEKLGGDVDIKFITDIDELRNQLATALGVPLQMLGGHLEDMPSGLGSSALDRYSILYARTTRRLQRALINGVARLFQIHLAYMGIDASPNRFNVKMGETSTAEEEEINNGLEKGLNSVEKIMTMYGDALGEDLDKEALLDFLNQKILKLTDVELKQFKKTKTMPEKVVTSKKQYIAEDLRAMLPEVNNSLKENKATNQIWEKQYKNMVIEIKEVNSK